jgi:hypothetical protein
MYANSREFAFIRGLCVKDYAKVLPDCGTEHNRTLWSHLMGSSKGRYFALVILGISLGVILVVLAHEVRDWVRQPKVVVAATPQVTLSDGRVIECTPDTVARWLGAQKRLAETQAELSRANDTIAALEARLRDFGQTAAGQTSPTDATSSGASGESAGELSADDGPQDEKTKKLKALIASTDWDKMATAIEKWIKIQRDARKKGQPPVFDPALLQELSRSTVTMSQIAELLGLDSPWDAYGNDLVIEKFMPAYLKAQGVELTDAQQTALLGWLKTQQPPGEGSGEVDAMGRPHSFNGLLQAAQREVQFTEWIRNNLTDRKSVV